MAETRMINKPSYSGEVFLEKSPWATYLPSRFSSFSSPLSAILDQIRLASDHFLPHETQFGTHWKAVHLYQNVLTSWAIDCSRLQSLPWCWANANVAKIQVRNLARKRRFLILCKFFIRLIAVLKSRRIFSEILHSAAGWLHVWSHSAHLQ